MRHSVERDEVVFAGRVQLDVLDQDHLLVPGLEDRGEHVTRLLAETGELFLVGPGDPVGGLQETVPIRVLADRDEDLADGAGDTLAVHRSRGQFAHACSPSSPVEPWVRSSFSDPRTSDPLSIASSFLERTGGRSEG